MDFLWNFIFDYGIAIILILIILEYSCFPLPSEIILPITGAFTLIKNYNIFFIIFLSVIAGIIGSSICYVIGHIGNKFILNKIKNNNFNKFKSSLEVINKYGFYSIAIGRLIPLYRTYISFIAGINKLNFFKYTLYTTIGISIWNTILILLGYNFYNNLNLIIEIYNKYTIIILITVLLLTIIILLIKIKRGKYETRKNCKNKRITHIRPKKSSI